MKHLGIVKFFDKLENKIRGWLSNYPFLYGAIGAVGVVLAWRGIWHTADFVSARIHNGIEIETISYPFLWDGFWSLIIGTIMLLLTGLFITSFIGNNVIISHIKSDDRLAKKTEEEVEGEENIIEKVHEELHTLSKRLEEIEKKLDIKR